jgi:PAS domain S-box-containing protein
MAVDDDIGALVNQTLLGDAWENAGVAVAVFAEDGRYLACNRAFYALTGYTREEIARMRVGRDLAADAAASTKLFRDLVAGKRAVGRGALRRKDGSVVDVNVWAIETRAANLPYYVVLYWPSAERPKRSELG